MTNFEHIKDKAIAGERLSFEDGVFLSQHQNLPELGALANTVRERLHGDTTYFNVNMHLNATNVCEASCTFCGFARLEEGMPEAYTMTLEQALEKVRSNKNPGLTEVHIVNGLHPGLPFAYYEDLLRAIKKEHPHIHLKAFTAVEIEYFANKFSMSRKEVLERLIKCGLGSLPGGGAEIFAERVRAKICHDKVDAAGWLDIHEIAHGLGLKSNATMLYGTIETLEERVDHMCQLRQSQDNSGGYQCFVPLAFHPAHTSLERLAPPTAVEDLRIFALSRLMLDNIPHIKAYWTMLGQKTAQVALWFGANDMDGTVEEEKIYHMAGAQTPSGLSRIELVRLIKVAGRTAVERDTTYNAIKRDEPDMPVHSVTGRPHLRIVTTEQPV